MKCFQIVSWANSLARVKNLKIFGESINTGNANIIVVEDAKRFDFSLKQQGFGDCEIDGKPFKGKFSKQTFNEVNDIEKLSIKNLSVEIKPATGQIGLENLSKTTNLPEIPSNRDHQQEFLNIRFSIRIPKLIVPMQRAIELKFLKVANRIVENFTYEELFPEKSADKIGKIQLGSFAWY